MENFKTMKEITDAVFKEKHECGFVEGNKMRELSDEEILESFAFYFGSTLNNKAYNDGAILFAKDILKKAQEK